MTNHELLADRFEASRARLQGVAWRMLGSASEAEDAVQEAWLRLGRADAGEVANLEGWLTTVVARVCLDMLRSRKARREEALDAGAAIQLASAGIEGNPEQEAIMADSVRLALLVVLDTLAPAERLAFVLHDMFAVPFEEIAPIVGRTPVATRQLASRARRRVQGAEAESPDRSRQRTVVKAFLAASRDGDFETLLSLLDPEAVLRADAQAVRFGATPRIQGAAAVARGFSGRARAARVATIDGMVGAVWAPGGKPRVVIGLTFDGDRIVAVDLVADRNRLEAMEVVILDD